MRVQIDTANLKTPLYLIDEKKLISNLTVLQKIKKETAAHILLAQKAFSMFSLYPLIADYLDGTTASSLHEAKLGFEEFGKETHIFSPAFVDEEFSEILEICDHIVFNTHRQWKRFAPKIKASSKKISCGLRINPEYSEVGTDLYNPSGRYSRLGITKREFDQNALSSSGVRIEGLHFHTLCEQNSDALLHTLQVIEQNFSEALHQVKWINFGGGHHITREDYDVDVLIGCIRHMQSTYDLDVYLEPGEAVVLNSGYLISRVVDTVKNEKDILILDTSATCHMPDVLEMPYRPPVSGGYEPFEKEHNYLLAGPSCLAGDVVGEYSFSDEKRIGDTIVFGDMAHYTMVKNTTFNGIRLPSIAILRDNGNVEIIKEFGYDDFKSRLS